mmetsp:Transcript_104866/g.321239  ORF Transcript_104866/g.321239 Transcript_104866/m.321239 type:complete len:392 (-) Transcript_104866:103-1278(-)
MGHPVDHLPEHGVDGLGRGPQHEGLFVARGPARLHRRGSSVLPVLPERAPHPLLRFQGEEALLEGHVVLLRFPLGGDDARGDCHFTVRHSRDGVDRGRRELPGRLLDHAPGADGQAHTDHQDHEAAAQRPRAFHPPEDDQSRDALCPPVLSDVADHRVRVRPRVPLARAGPGEHCLLPERAVFYEQLAARRHPPDAQSLRHRRDRGVVVVLADRHLLRLSGLPDADEHADWGGGGGPQRGGGHREGRHHGAQPRAGHAHRDGHTRLEHGRPHHEGRLPQAHLRAGRGRDHRARRRRPGVLGRHGAQPVRAHRGGGDQVRGADRPHSEHALVQRGAGEGCPAELPRPQDDDAARRGGGPDDREGGSPEVARRGPGGAHAGAGGQYDGRQRVL